MSDPQKSLRSLLRDPATPARREAVWRGVVERRDTARHGVAPWLMLGTAALMAGVLMFVLRALRPEDAPVVATKLPNAPAAPITPEPAARALTLSDGTAIPALALAATDAPRTLVLSDGSRISLEAGAELAPSASTAQELSLSLLRGAATFEVSPQGSRVFRVTAREVDVRVVGTRFRVACAENDVGVEVSHGTVRVAAAQLPEGKALVTAGQSVRVPLTPQAVSVAASGADDASVALRNARAAANRGEFEKAFALLGERGFERAVASARAVDQLLLLADTARLSGHPAAAVEPLERIVNGYAKHEHAPLAALTLARLQLDQLRSPAAAVRAIDKALELGLPQGLVEDAYARRVEALAKAGRKPEAQAAAAAYIARFPQGRRASAVQKWAAQ